MLENLVFVIEAAIGIHTRSNNEEDIASVKGKGFKSKPFICMFLYTL